MNKFKLRAGTDWNYAYDPDIFKTVALLLEAKPKLENECVNPRRYFYPSLNNLPYVNSSECIVSEDSSKKILCLPLYTEIKQEELNIISNLINQ